MPTILSTPDTFASYFDPSGGVEIILKAQTMSTLPLSPIPHRVWTSLNASTLLVLLFTFSMVTFPVNRVTAETWTNLRGTHSVEARMIGLWGDSVILEMSNGKRVSVKLSDLRSESRIQAQELARELDGGRASRVQEMQGQAAAAAAAAPDPIPEPPAAPAYLAPQKDAQVGDFLAQIDSAVANGHVVAIYDALPPSYRKDVDDIVQLAAQRINMNSWQGLVGTAHRLGDLIVTHQNWFLSSPRIQALPPDQFEVVDEQVLGMAGLLRVALSPEATDLNQLQSMSFGQWLAQHDQQMAPYLARLVDQMDVEVERQISVTSVKGDAATIAIQQNGATRPVQMVKVEGYWVPKSLADRWAQNVGAWKQDIAGTTSQIDTLGAVVGQLSPALDPLERASNAGEFHAAMEGLFSPIVETAVVTLATAFGKNTSLASNARGRGNAGYNQGYGYDDMDMEMGMEDEMGMEMEMEMEMGMGMDDQMGMEAGYGGGSSGPPRGGAPGGFGGGSGPPQGYGGGSGPPRGGAPGGYGGGSGPPQGYGGGSSGPPQGGVPQGYGGGSGPPRG